MSNALDVTKQTFQSEVLNSALPVLVDFWAPWCMPCRMMGPTLDELSTELEGKLRIVKVNTNEEENQEIAQQYQIQSIPNLKLFVGGKVIQEFVGLQSKDDLKESLLNAIK
ncbi:MAG: thioredoxin [Planctomycetes bacterium]|jgi:thioredoxin 1|nr:thioredoxin [Planctomycetota bacterium]